MISSHFYPACGLKWDLCKAMVPVLFQSAGHFSLLISQASNFQRQKLMLLSPFPSPYFFLFLFLLNILIVSTWRGWYFFPPSCPHLASYGWAAWFNLHLCAQISFQGGCGDRGDLGHLLTCRHAGRDGKTEV